MSSVENMTMASQYLEAQIKTLNSLGFATSKSLDVLEITDSQLADKYARFDVATLIPLYEAAARALSNPSISLETGFQFRVSTFQKTGNIYTVCDNIRQVVEMNRRYQRVAIYAGDVSLIEDKNPPRPYLNFEPFYSNLENSHHITNLIFGAYGSAFRWLNWGTGKGLKHIWLKQAPPESTGVYKEVFDCPVTFSAPYNRLEFFPEHIDLEFPTRNRVKRAQFEAQLDHVLKAASKSDSFLMAAQLILDKLLKEGRVNFSDFSAAIGMSEPKVRKSFKSAETNFRKQLELARIRNFKSLIAEGNNYAVIAQKLCYNDQAAFSRAFKRWYGVAPGDWTEDLPLKSV
jgi:AraC-like DNA-binding protein